MMKVQDNDSSLNYPLKCAMVFNPFHFRKEDMSYYPFIAVSLKRRRLLHAAFWIITTVACFSFISFVKPPLEAAARAGIILVCLMLLLYGTRILIHRYYEKKRYGHWIWFSCLLVMTIAVLRAWFDLGILHSITFKPGRISYADSGAAVKLYIFFVLVGFIFMALGSLYFIAKNRLILEHHYFKLRLQHVETQLSYLKAQANPHFLFNTLNNIYAAAELKNPNAPGMILQLSQLLRYLTYTVQHKKIDLTEEWEQIENYIKLFCSRDPAGNYPITLKAEGDLRRIQIPPMLLLPIVENACKYSDVHEQADSSYLKICLLYKNGRLQFLVTNTFNTCSRQPDMDGGIGNDNIRKRLELEYPGCYSLRTENEKNVFTANLTLNLND